MAAPQPAQPAYLSDVPGGIRIAIKAVPGASRDQIAGPLGDRLKVKVAAAPEDGKANDAICRLLARTLGLAPRSVEVESGHSRPEKLILAKGITAAQATVKLA
jgi:uncharacterized protein